MAAVTKNRCFFNCSIALCKVEMSWNCEHPHPLWCLSKKGSAAIWSLIYVPAFFIWNIEVKLKTRWAITVFWEPVVYSLFSCFSPHDQVNLTKVSCEMDCSNSTNLYSSEILNACTQMTSMCARWNVPILSQDVSFI